MSHGPAWWTDPRCWITSAVRGTFWVSWSWHQCVVGQQMCGTLRLSWQSIKLVSVITRSNGFLTVSGMSWSTAGPTPCWTHGGQKRTFVTAKEKWSVWTSSHARIRFSLGLKPESVHHGLRWPPDPWCCLNLIILQPVFFNGKHVPSLSSPDTGRGSWIFLPRWPDRVRVAMLIRQTDDSDFLGCA